MMHNLIERLRSKGNNFLAEISLRTGRSFNRPTYICAKMTMRCNSRCVHCNIWKMDYAEQEMTTEEWCQTLNRLREWLGRFNMVFTGGEALLRNDMLGILSYAASKGIRVELLSNSILVDDLLAKGIVDTGIAQFTTSFDGVSPEIHDRFRGSDGFHAKVVAAISTLNMHRQKQQDPMKILLKTVISANNLAELAAIARYSREQDVDVLYQPIEQNYGEKPKGNWYKTSPLWIQDVEKLKEEVELLKELKRQGYPITNSEDDLSTIIRYFEHPDELMSAVQAHDARSAADICRHAVTNFVISSNGDVQMCFKMKPIGNLRSSSPKEIWDKRARCWAANCNFR